MAHLLMTVIVELACQNRLPGFRRQNAPAARGNHPAPGPARLESRGPRSARLNIRSRGKTTSEVTPICLGGLFAPVAQRFQPRQIALVGPGWRGG